MTIHKEESGIEIFDELIPYNYRTGFYDFARKSKFMIGWADSEEYEKLAYPCLHSTFSEEELHSMKILPFIHEALAQSQFKSFLKAPIDKIKLNLSKPGDIHYSHTHSMYGKLDQCVALCYLNIEWKPEWGGETLFWNDLHTAIKFTSPYVPGRVILFDGRIPHSIRPQTHLGPSFRFTLSVFFKKLNIPLL